MNKEKLKELFIKIKALEIEKLKKSNYLEYEEKDRNKKIDFLKSIEILQEQPTREKPIIIDNYPYGFKRTKIKYFIETNKKGDRFISQTLNPKTQEWNKEKLGVYSSIGIVYKDLTTNYIKYFNIDFYGYLYTIEPLILSCVEVLNKEQEQKLKEVISILYTNCFLSVSAIETTNETKEQEQTRKEKDKNNMEEVKKLFCGLYGIVKNEV